MMTKQRGMWYKVSYFRNFGGGRLLHINLLFVINCQLVLSLAMVKMFPMLSKMSVSV